MRSIVSITSFMLLSLVASISSAALVPVHVTAQVFTIDPALFYSLSLVGVTNGTIVDAVVVIDTNAVDSLSGDPTRGTYQGAITSVSISAGTWSATTLRGSCCQSTVTVINQNQPFPPDRWTAQATLMSAPDVPSAVGTFTYASISLVESAGAAISSDSIVPPTSNVWDANSQLYFADPNGAYLNAYIISSHVPEPSVVLLFCAAVVAIRLAMRTGSVH